MIKLALTREESIVLREIVEAEMDDLRVQIVSTDRLDFKGALKDRKMVLSQICEKLKEVESEYSPVA